MATNTAASFTNHTGNGSAGPFSISFSYLSEAEVDVTVGGVLKTITTHYTFTSGTQITFTSGNEPGNGVAINIQRDTNISAKKVDFNDGSVLTEADLDTQNDQVLFAVQENLRKLDTIEESATADQTDAEIRTAVGNATDSNVFTDAEKTKLAGITTAATPDQTASEIRTLVESASDSNVFTDADHTKLNAIEASATADQTGAEIKSAYEGESNTNAFTDAEKTKLSGIETSATADQTNAEIRDAVEAATDSNVFTDADHTKLNAVEASADVTDATNVDAAGAVMNSDLDGKGEILVGDGSGDPTALALGTNGYILTADSTEAAGVKWAANAGGGGGTGISNVVEDTTPQLGGNLDVNGQDIVSTSNGDIDLDPNGSGKVVAKGNATRGSGQLKLNCEQNSHGVIIKGPPHSAAADYTLTLPNTDGAANQVLKSDGSGNLDWVNQTTDTVVGGATGVDFNDNVKSRYGSSNELEVYHDSTYNIIDNASADLHIKHGSEFQAKFNQDGAVEIYYDGNVRLATTNAGLTATGTVTATTFSGSGASLTSLPAANLTGTLPAISAANLTNVPAANITGTLPAISATNLTNIPAANITGTLPAISGANLTAVDAATVDGIDSASFLRSDAADSASGLLTLNGGIALTGKAAANITALSDGSTITIDMATACHHSVTLGGNRTFAAPSNQGVGQAGSIFITQDGSGSRTASFNAAFKFVGGTAPTLSTAAAAVDRIDYIILSSNVIHCAVSLDVK